MVFKKTLFDDDQLMDQPKNLKKEVQPLESSRDLKIKSQQRLRGSRPLRKKKPSLKEG